MVGILLLLTLVTSPCESWLVQTSDTEIHVGVTENVTISCRFNDSHHGQLPIQDVMQILIRRSMNAQILATFKVRVGKDEPVIHPGGASPGLSVKGHAGKPKDSFLSLTWSKASQDTVGEFGCLVEGYTKQDSIARVDTNQVSVIDSPYAFNEIVSLLLDLKRRVDENQANQKDIGTRVDESLYELRKWPAGMYALLNTLDGCPNSTTAVWREGFIKFHSESDKAKSLDAVSDPNHMAGPALTSDNINNYFYIRTCKRDFDALGPGWPKGSYCVHRAGGKCPHGFADGGMYLDAEDRVPRHKQAADNPDLQWIDTNDRMGLYFCCRNDRDHDVPILLPTEKPFYLYRYKGKCQKVHGTVVTEEWFSIDTENKNNGDSYIPNVHPDAQLNPVRMFLCYYSPLDQSP